MKDSFIARAAREGTAALAAAPAMPDGMVKPYILVLVSTDVSGTTHVFQGDHRLQITNHEMDFTFGVPFDDDPVPNEGELTVYNLAPESIADMQVGDILSITCGYNEDMGVVFYGRIYAVETVWDGPDRMTTVYATDTGAGNAYIEETYHEGVSASFILQDLCARSELPVGEFSVTCDHYFEEAVTVEGNLNEQIAEYASMCGVWAYVVRGVLYVKNMLAEPESKVIVNEQTGLLEGLKEFSQEVKDRRYGQEEGKITYQGYTLRSLLNHRLVPGAGVALESRNAQGNYIVKQGKHTYDGVSMVTEATVIEY